jgi:hypothetical protein
LCAITPQIVRDHDAMTTPAMRPPPAMMARKANGPACLTPIFVFV